MPQTIKLMADYQSWPLWWSGDHDPGNIDPQTLPLHRETIHRLEVWADSYDATLNLDNPQESGFVDEQALAQFDAEGVRLWLQLREELAPAYEVLYKSVRRRDVLDDPAQLIAQ